MSLRANMTRALAGRCAHEPRRAGGEASGDPDADRIDRETDHGAASRNEASQRLESIPGIGVIGATAIAATVPDPKVFRSGRDFAAPREDSTGGKQKLGPISKQGDRYLRRILVVGA